MAEECDKTRSLRPRNIFGWVKPPPPDKKNLPVASPDNIDSSGVNKEQVSEKKVLSNTNEIAENTIKEGQDQSSKVVGDNAATSSNSNAKDNKVASVCVEKEVTKSKTINIVLPNDGGCISLPTFSQVLQNVKTIEFI